MRYDEIKDELGDLLSQALTPSAVWDKPSIKPSPTVRNISTTSNSNNNSEEVVDQHQKRGDLLVRGQWERSKHCVIDVKITDVNQPSYINRFPKKVLETAENSKKSKYLEDCLEQRRDFTPFIASVDGLLGKEAQMLLKKISELLARKWGRPYSKIASYVNARISIALTRATNLCIRGSRTPVNRISSCRPLLEDSAGFGNFK